MPKIVIDDNIPFIKGRLEPFAETVYVDQFGFTPEIVRDADAVVIRTRTRCNEALLKGSSVKLVATATIGMDQIDLPWCASAGITVRNAPGCNAPGVAQYVWSSLLRSGFDPERQTLGVVGCGNVGSVVAEWGRLLGANVLVNDPPKGLGVGLDELLRESDAVTLHTPLTRGGEWPSFHLIGEREIGMMKPGSLLVNAARGPVVDTPAVIQGVREGKITAVIDTWEGEPDLNRELLGLVDIGTFHIAGYSLEGKQRATRMALEAVAVTFGWDIDMSGLEPAYVPKESLTAEQILASYDPHADTAPLKAAPEQFDNLRANYNYRREV